MGLPVWGGLQKSQTDPETIEQAVGRIVDEHNENEEAHLDTGQALQSHKASEIIDHIAESIVNDKIKYVNRAFNAVVSDVAGDFTDIQDAINYVSENGGGDVLITIATYTLSADLVLRNNVSLTGFGVSLSLINCNGHQVITSQSLSEEDPDWEESTNNVEIRDIGFYGGADHMIYAYGQLTFQDCKFYGVNGTLLDDVGGGNVYSNCQFLQTYSWFLSNVNNNYYGIYGHEGVAPKIYNCEFQYCPIACSLGEDGLFSSNHIYHCRRGVITTAPGCVVDGNNMVDCLEYGVRTEHNLAVITGNFIMGDERAGYYSSQNGVHVYYTTNIGTDNIVEGNRIYKFVYGIKFATSSSKNIALGNNCRSNQSGGVSDSGSNNLVDHNITS